MFNKAIIRCNLGSEQFMFIHRDGSYIHEKGDIAALLLNSHLEEAWEFPGRPWLSFVWSPKLGEHVFRGSFSNAQVHNFTSFAKVEITES